MKEFMIFYFMVPLIKLKLVVFSLWPMLDTQWQMREEYKHYRDGDTDLVINQTNSLKLMTPLPS
jgi:hypothetical protein